MIKVADRDDGRQSRRRVPPTQLVEGGTERGDRPVRRVLTRDVLRIDFGIGSFLIGQGDSRNFIRTTKLEDFDSEPPADFRRWSARI